MVFAVILHSCTIEFFVSFDCRSPDWETCKNFSRRVLDHRLRPRHAPLPRLNILRSATNSQQKGAARTSDYFLPPIVLFSQLSHSRHHFSSGQFCFLPAPSSFHPSTYIRRLFSLRNVQFFLFPRHLSTPDPAGFPLKYSLLIKLMPRLLIPIKPIILIHVTGQ